jgi:hypothetical protein
MVGERASPRTERARPEFHASLEPADRLALHERVHGAVDQGVVGDDFECRADAAEALLDLILLEGRAEIGAVHAVARAVQVAWFVPEQVVGRERRADRAPGVARRRLNPDPLELAIPQDLAVGDAVEGDAARETQILLPGLARQRPGQPQHYLLGYRLNGGRQIHVALAHQLVGLARPAAEQLIELAVGHGQAYGIIEVFLVEAERAVVLEIYQMIEDQPGVLRLAVRRQAHHFVFARIDLEPGVVGEGRVQEAERVRKMQLFQHLQPMAITEADARGRPFADAVDGEDRGLLER